MFEWFIQNTTFDFLSLQMYGFLKNKIIALYKKESIEKNEYIFVY